MGIRVEMCIRLMKLKKNACFWRANKNEFVKKAYVHVHNLPISYIALEFTLIFMDSRGNYI